MAGRIRSVTWISAGQLATAHEGIAGMAGHAATLGSHTTVDPDLKIDSRAEFAQVVDRQEQLDENAAVGIPNYAAFSRLAGSCAYLPKWAEYRVQYRSLFRSHRNRLLAAVVIVADLSFGIFFCV